MRGRQSKSNNFSSIAVASPTAAAAAAANATVPRGRGGEYHNGRSFIVVVVLVLVFCLGLMIGSQWTMTNQYYDSTRNLEMSSSPTLSSSSKSWDPTTSEDGWQTVNVYYGSSNLKEQASLSSQSQQQQQSIFVHSQARQDECVLSLLHNQTNGYFIDLASNDATILSNTYSLERYFGWNGLCIEPNPTYWYNLTHYRPRCTIVSAVLGTRTGQVMDFLYSGNEHGGIVGAMFDNTRKKDSVQEYTITLHDIFQKYDVPRVIDYMSLDVEGAEEFIMNDFDFDTYTFKILTIERPKDGLRQLLERHNYKQIQRLSRWGETLWINSNWEDKLDMTRLEEFSGKRQWQEQKRREQLQQQEEQQQ
mmetsp:Transcript_47075/g.114900  ORF Transcript_47075/g.114900 Transcript_47075/m.114900 type:complete len:362 (-) Transcript_47075:1738-2823(-)